MKLRMSFLAAPVLVGTKRIPFFIRNARLEREAGQDDHPLRHHRDSLQDRSDGGRRRGNSSSDREARRRLGPPALGKPMEQDVAAFGKIHGAKLPQPLRPQGEDCLKPVERHLPVPGQLGSIQRGVGEFRRFDLLDQQCIERSRELGGHSYGFDRALAFRSDQLGECEQPLQRIDRRGHRIVESGGIERSTDPIVDFRIPDRDQARKNQPGSAGADEGFREAPNRAIVGKKDTPARERNRIAAEACDQACNQRVREGSMRRDCEDGARAKMVCRPLRHLPGSAPSPLSPAGCRHRTTAPGGRRRSTAPLQSPGPTTGW